MPRTIENICYSLPPPAGAPQLALTSHQVAYLTRPQRLERVATLVQRSTNILESALDSLSPEREVVAIALMFSGGKDSTVLSHIFRTTATHAVMANTGVGLEETRQFVRDTCAVWDIPLLERKPPPGTYVNRVMAYGFPHPSDHPQVFSQLKERSFDATRRHLTGLVRSMKRTVVFLGGRRRDESRARRDVPFWAQKGSVLRVDPLVEWTTLDMSTYRLMQDAAGTPVPVNPVSDILGMSGECLCGCFGTPGEREMLEDYFPRAARWFSRLEARLDEADEVDPQKRRWGWHMTRRACGDECWGPEGAASAVGTDDAKTLVVPPRVIQ